MTTIQDINSTIIAGNFTNDQLNSIMTAITFARNQLAQKISLPFVQVQV